MKNLNNSTQNNDYLEQVEEFTEEYGRLGAAVLRNFNGDLEEAVRAVTVGYIGKYLSLADYAKEAAESFGIAAKYLDHERIARDLEMSGEIFTLEISAGEVHVFHAI